MNPSFVIASDKNFTEWVKISVSQIKRYYPNSMVWLIDLNGNKSHELESIAMNSKSNYVFWDIDNRKNWPQKVDNQNIKTIPKNTYGLEASFKRKLWNKYILKDEKYSMNDEEKIKDYQRLLRIYCQKPFFLKHVREHQDGEIVFIDADAFIINSLDDAFETEFDVGVTLRKKEELKFDIGNCQVLNSGVLFLGKNKVATTGFLNEWGRSVTNTSEEYCIEQTALSRMIYKSLEDAKNDNHEVRIQRWGNSHVSIKSFSCVEYNFNWVKDIIDCNKNRILHFKGGRHLGARALKNAINLVEKTRK